MRDSIVVRKWLDTAVSGIRFGPDRKAARAVLEAKYLLVPYRLTLHDGRGEALASQAGTLPP